MKKFQALKIYYWIVYNASKEEMSGNIDESLLGRNESGKQYHGSLKN